MAVTFIIDRGPAQENALRGTCMISDNFVTYTRNRKGGNIGGWGGVDGWSRWLE